MGELTQEAIRSAMDELRQKQLRPDCYCEYLPDIPCPRHEPEAYEGGRHG